MVLQGPIVYCCSDRRVERGSIGRVGWYHIFAGCAAAGRARCTVNGGGRTRYCTWRFDSSWVRRRVGSTMLRSKLSLLNAAALAAVSLLIGGESLRAAFTDVTNL